MDRIDALRALTRLADLQTFTAAARSLRVKQSTVSKWIARLEADFGAQLVHRGARGGGSLRRAAWRAAAPRRSTRRG